MKSSIEEGSAMTEPVPFWQLIPPTWTPSAEEYYGRVDLVGSSALADFRTSKRLYAGRYITKTVGQKVQTGAMLMGSVVDVLLTEPEAFEQYYSVTDAFRRGTKSWASDQAAHPTQELVKRELYELATEMAESVLHNPIAAGILTGAGCSQVCHTWEDLGVPCRMRLDRVFATAVGGAFADLKNWNRVEPDDISREIFNRGTHRQMALYERGFVDLYGFKPKILLVVAHNEPPFEVAVYQMSESFLRLGRRDVEYDLTQLGACLESGDFSNWWETEIEELQPPKWAT